MEGKGEYFYNIISLTSFLMKEITLGFFSPKENFKK